MSAGGISATALDALKTGFSFSVVTLVLCLFYAALFLAGFAHYLLTPLFLPPLVLLCKWVYSLAKRFRAWNLLGQEYIGRAMIVEGILVFVFFFPFTYLLMHFFALEVLYIS